MPPLLKNMQPVRFYYFFYQRVRRSISHRGGLSPVARNQQLKMYLAVAVATTVRKQNTFQNVNIAFICPKRQSGP